MTYIDEINRCKEARFELLKMIKEEFAGPDKGGDILFENPVTRYSCGMLFPDVYENREGARELDDEGMDEQSTDEAIEDEDEGSTPSLGVAQAGSFYPSAMGLSFYCKGKTPKVNVTVNWSSYRKLEQAENYVAFSSVSDMLAADPLFTDNFVVKEGRLYSFNTIEDEIIKGILEKHTDESLRHALYLLQKQEGGWIREENERVIPLGLGTSKQQIGEALMITSEAKADATAELALFTVALTNTNPACPGMDEGHVFFNVCLSAQGEEGKDIFTEYQNHSLLPQNAEEQSLELLYYNRKTFAVGHGCAADWETSTGGNTAVRVFSQILPTYEVPQVEFTVEGIDESALSMKNLSGAGNTDKDIVDLLQGFCLTYKKWIESTSALNDVPPKLKTAASRHMDECRIVLDRMVEGVTILKTNPIAIAAFKLANQAMLMQSLHSDLLKEQKRANVGLEVQWPDYNGKEALLKAWRPFQLAFLLLSVKGITDPSSEDREIVDLIWFQTGGGKTEAYLGLAALGIFYRRMTQGKSGGGTTVMMRYTLRLLTSQQFQRASTLICAMEKLRRSDSNLLGEEEISIGLWVGQESTPNTFTQAREKFEEFLYQGSNKNPSPMLSCPWCGTRMVVTEGRKSFAYKELLRPKRWNLHCYLESCDFAKRLPVLIVDEEIYKFPPTLLFGTVDKFAQIPWQEGAASLFGANPGNPSLPPELIIQDELHLISGALGTMVGLYETAVDFLCSRKGVSPKIIASTATVRRADEQCLAIFNRKVKQFPPPGVDISDSFFARESPLAAKPGRLYVGIMPSGKTQTTAAVRLTAALIRAVYHLEQDVEIKDKYWTLVSYFNSIRELGGFISLAYDDIPIYATALRQRYGGKLREFQTRELTSRKGAEEVVDILEKLSVAYDGAMYKAIDILAATNMISVGVDVDRLALMTIRGQPKLTSEYIQVSSRIGRRYPGLVATLFNSARTRDRAHYERFKTYHQSFYRYVEPSSVTPFSSPARARGLAGILVSMVRHGTGTDEMNSNAGAHHFDAQMKILGEAKEYLRKRVESLDPREAEETMKEFDSLCSDWENFTKSYAEAGYRSAQGFGLMAASGGGEKGQWVVPTSMRNVDAECTVQIREYDQ